MRVTFDIPNELEQALRREFGDVAEATKEAALVELYRQGRISAAELARAMNLTRLEAEAVLHRHGVVEDLPTAAEHETALSHLRKHRRT